MGIGSDIRAKLPLCGTCVNCKLIVWDDNVGDDDKKKLNKFKGMDGTKFYTVRCSWLKAPVSEPQFLDTCEGKQLQKNEG